MKLLKVIIRILCFLLAVGIVLTGVFFRENSVSKVAFNSQIFSSPVSQELHRSEQSSFEQIASSGFIELYFNKTTSEIAVRELSQDHWWYALPNGAVSSMLTMEIIGKGGKYYLNSQDNSVAFSQWQYDILENGVRIIYRLSDQKRDTFTSEDIAFEAILSVILKDGSLFTDCQVRNLTDNDNCAVSSLSVLPGLCSFENPGQEDFLLIPDGCGAVVYPALCEGTKAFEAKVYGDDYSVKTISTADAIMGAFGVKTGESAIAVIIDSGEEIATVKAVSDKNSLSSVYADFEIYDCAVNDEAYLSHNPYGDCVSLCYKFLSGDNASYSEIASSCREQFIRNGSLPSTDVEMQESVPLYLTLTGAYKSSAWSPINVKYTTFSQALDILSRVKSKGVDNIAVRYTGVLKQNSASVVSSLGSKKDFQELCDYAFSQNISMFIDADILSYPSVFGKFDFSAVKAMNKSTAVAVENKSPDETADNTVKFRFRKSEDISSFVADLIELEADNSISGYCIGDGEYLVSDYSANNVSRGKMKTDISAQLPALANAGGVMTDKGNMYMLKNSSAVINMPMTVYYDECEYYVAIPFVQSVLHGRVTVAGTPINTQQDMKTATLQCIEYGVCPSFTTVYIDKNQKNNLLFDNIVNDLVDCYSIAADALFGLESERITAHECLKDGVYLTTYGDAAMIYVNYNNAPATVSGVTIPAKSYLRID
ncbi:MAG: hypothetical protein IJZ57_01555 [Clostridia bacterium]|nr:hypothetical protein [Clostridia bacterium]